MVLAAFLKMLFWRVRDPRVLEHMLLLKGCFEDDPVQQEKFVGRGYRKEIGYEMVKFLNDRGISFPEEEVENMIKDCERAIYEGWESLPMKVPDDLHRAIRDFAFQYVEGYCRRAAAGARSNFAPR